jgi:hypothetical protein
MILTAAQFTGAAAGSAAATNSRSNSTIALDRTAVPNFHQHYEPSGTAGVLFAAFQTKGDRDMASSRSGGSKRGFAAMDPAKQREIASKGGKASHGGGRKSSSHR